MAKGQRDSKREAFWRGVLARHRDSGLNIRAFCQQAKVTEASFYAWRRTLQQRDAEQARQPAPAGRADRRRGPREPRPSRPTFVPLVVRGEQACDADAGITIVLGHGSRTRTLRLPVTIAAERLAELVRAVEAVPAPMEHCS